MIVAVRNASYSSDQDNHYGSMSERFNDGLLLGPGTDYQMGLLQKSKIRHSREGGNPENQPLTGQSKWIPAKIMPE